MELLLWWFGLTIDDQKLLLSWKLHRHDGVLNKLVYQDIVITDPDLDNHDSATLLQLSENIHRFDKVVLTSKYSTVG